MFSSCKNLSVTNDISRANIREIFWGVLFCYLLPVKWHPCYSSKVCIIVLLCRSCHRWWRHCWVLGRRWCTSGTPWTAWWDECILWCPTSPFNSVSCASFLPSFSQVLSDVTARKYVAQWTKILPCLLALQEIRLISNVHQVYQMFLYIFWW